MKYFLHQTNSHEREDKVAKCPFPASDSWSLTDIEGRKKGGGGGERIISSHGPKEKAPSLAGAKPLAGL
jgi:hypothetical protein